MAAYKVVISRPAQKQINAIDSRKNRAAIVGKIQSLAQNPRPLGCKRLTNVGDERGEYCRVRQGVFRVIYQIREEEVEVAVIKVGHRQHVYKKL